MAQKIYPSQQRRGQLLNTGQEDTTGLAVLIHSIHGQCVSLVL